MATYNPTTGTGGMDASIRYETDRPEVRVRTQFMIVNLNSLKERW